MKKPTKRRCPAPTPCEPHTPEPFAYLDWHEWAERMGKTHKQRQCKGCGLYAIWEPKGVPGLVKSLRVLRDFGKPEAAPEPDLFSMGGDQ